VTVTNGFGCTASSASPINTVIVNPILQHQQQLQRADQSSILSVGNSVVLTSSASETLWSSGQNNTPITVTTTGSYTVTQTFAGCTSVTSASDIYWLIQLHPLQQLLVWVYNDLLSWWIGSSDVNCRYSTLWWSTNRNDTQSITAVVLAPHLPFKLLDGPL